MTSDAIYDDASDEDGSYTVEDAGLTNTESSEEEPEDPADKPAMDTDDESTAIVVI